MAITKKGKAKKDKAKKDAEARKRSEAAKKAAATRKRNAEAAAKVASEGRVAAVTARNKAGGPQAVHESSQGLERRPEPKPANPGRTHAVPQKVVDRVDAARK